MEPTPSPRFVTTTTHSSKHLFLTNIELQKKSAERATARPRTAGAVAKETVRTSTTAARQAVLDKAAQAKRTVEARKPSMAVKVIRVPHQRHKGWPRNTGGDIPHSVDVIFDVCWK